MRQGEELFTYEAYRIRKIWDLSYADGELATEHKFVAENDAAIGLFFIFVRMLYKQSTYTKTEFCVQQMVAKAFRQNLGTSPSEISNDVVLMLSLVSGIATDVVAPAECPDSEFNFESYLNDLVTVQDAVAFHVCPIRIFLKDAEPQQLPETTNMSFLVVILPVTCRVFPKIQNTLPCKWQLRTAHQSNKIFECGDYTTEFENDCIFEFATEENEEERRLA